MSTLLFDAEPAGQYFNQTLSNTFLNVAYGKSAAQRMDIYLPANRSAAITKSLILIHGGGWNSGSRHNITSYIDSFKKRIPEYAIFNVDYTLVNAHVTLSVLENDIKEAVDFISAHAPQYKINPGKLVLLGISAGAHLALLQAYKYDEPKIAAVIDFFGPTDLISMYTKPWHAMIPHLLEALLEGSPGTNHYAYKNASPSSFINAETPPTLILHGNQDFIVDISQSKSLHEKLLSAAVISHLEINNAGHGWFGTPLSNSFDKIATFLKQNLR